MEISNLQAFVAIAETGSFSIAADSLHLTQPAISKRIAALESGLDTRLFDRIGRGIALTEAGRALLPHARSILLEIEDSRRALSNLAGEVTGVLRVGTSHHIGLHHLPPALRAFTGRYPRVKLDLEFMDSEAACQAVVKGDLELGIVTLPPEDQAVLQSCVLWPDPLCVVTSVDHLLARQHETNIRLLADYPAILPAQGTYTRQIFEEALKPYGLTLNIGLSSNYLETIKMLVSVGLGWSVLPATLVDEQLCALDIEDLRIDRKLGAVWHRDRTLSNAAKALLDTLEPEPG